MEIQEQFDKIEALRNAYEVECKNSFANSADAIRAFRTWYMSAVEFFCEVLSDEDQLLQRFLSEDVSGNGYSLRDVYPALLVTYTQLRAKVKKISKQSEMQEITIRGEKDSSVDKIKPKKIFISHSSGDGEFATALVELLVLMGFDAKKEIFCSSVPDCWVEDGEDFIKVIKEHFDKWELYVIYIHSPRFYNSHIALNEMGAAWVLQREFSSFLTKDMSFSELDAVVPNTNVAIKVDALEAEARMNSWRQRILAWFGKAQMNDNFWESSRNKFLKTVRSLTYPKNEIATKTSIKSQKEDVCLSAKDEEILKQWVDSEDDTMYYGEILGGSAFLVLGKTQYAINSTKEKAEWRAFFQRLLSVNLVEQVGMEGMNPIYRLTATAYTYFE